MSPVINTKIVLYISVIAIISIFLLINICFKIKNNNENLEHMVDIKPLNNIENRTIKWKRNGSCSYNMTKVLDTVLKENKIKETKDDDYDLFVPCTYNKIKDEIKAAKLDKRINNNKRFFIVNNADELTSKSAIWKHLVGKYGRNYAKTLMPATYILSSKDDIELFKREYSKNKIYIMKKNIQRQEGLKITNKKSDILKGYWQNYVVAQELLQDPYLIDGRKINMRFYLLLVCQHNEIAAYVHRDGFMYYSKVPFVKGSLKDGPNITTGYIDRYVYEINPLTLEDFKKYLDDYDRMLTPAEIEILENKQFGISEVPNKNLMSDIVFMRIYDLLRKVVIAVSETTCVNSPLKDYLSFQLFGADVALNEDLHPQLMEVNKGPDLGSKDKRDGDLKHGVVTDIMKVLKIVKPYNNNFIKILDVEK